MHELITDSASSVDYSDGKYDIYFEFTRNLDRVWESCFYEVHPRDEGFGRLDSISLTGYKLRVVIDEDKLDSVKAGIHEFEMAHIKTIIEKTNHRYKQIQDTIRRLRDNPVPYDEG